MAFINTKNNSFIYSNVSGEVPSMLLICKYRLAINTKDRLLFSYDSGTITTKELTLRDIETIVSLSNSVMGTVRYNSLDVYPDFTIVNLRGIGEICNIGDTLILPHNVQAVVKETFSYDAVLVDKKLDNGVILDGVVTRKSSSLNLPEDVFTPATVPDFEYVVNGNTVSFAEVNSSNSEWDFGSGGMVSKESNPVVTYDSPGLYTVTMTSRGTVVTKVINVLSTVKPEIEFNLTVTNQRVRFDYEFIVRGGANEIETITLSLSDGRTFDHIPEFVDFSATGSYTAEITVRDNLGSQANLTVPITINQIGEDLVFINEPIVVVERLSIFESLTLIHDADDGEFQLRIDCLSSRARFQKRNLVGWTSVADGDIVTPVNGRITLRMIYDNNVLVKFTLNEIGEAPPSIVLTARAVLTEPTFNYVLVGDDLRNNEQNRMVSYYTTQLSKIGGTLINQSKSGLTAKQYLDNDDPSYGLTASLDLIPNDGTNCVLEYSLGLNDCLAGDNQETIKNTVLATLSALKDAKPKLTVFLVSTAGRYSDGNVFTVSSALNEVVAVSDYELYHSAEAVDSVYDGDLADGNRVFFHDATRPSVYGSVRIVNWLMDKIIPDNKRVLMTLDPVDVGNEVLPSLTMAIDPTRGMWSTSTGASVPSSLLCRALPITVEAGRKVRYKHQGERDEVVCMDSLGNFVTMFPVFEDGEGWREFTIPVNVTELRINITMNATSYLALNDVPEIEYVAASSLPILTQAEINAGLNIDL